MSYEQKLLYPAKKRAKLKGIECTIKKEDIKLVRFCPLLGIELDYSNDKGGVGTAKANSPSLDRINPKKGYTPDNVWVISRRANAIKNDASLEEIEMIAKNLRKKITGITDHVKPPMEWSAELNMFLPPPRGPNESAESFMKRTTSKEREALQAAAGVRSLIMKGAAGLKSKLMRSRGLAD